MSVPKKPNVPVLNAGGSSSWSIFDGLGETIGSLAGSYAEIEAAKINAKAAQPEVYVKPQHGQNSDGSTIESDDTPRANDMPMWAWGLIALVAIIFVVLLIKVIK